MRLNEVYIDRVKGREVFDSRGNPTVEADVILTDGTVGRAEVPSGASTGENEAIELRDGGKRLLGKGVTKAVAHVNNEINNALHGVSPFDQRQVDQIMIELDGTPNKAKLGANAILGVSMATARAAAEYFNEPLFRYLGGVDIELPQSFHNVINGGEHADNDIDAQEFMITPLKKSSFRDGINKIADVYHILKKVLESEGFETGVGDEGGFAPNMKHTEEAVEALYKAIKEAGYVPGEDIGIAMDFAASYFYDKDSGNYNFEGKTYTPEQFIDYVSDLIDKYPAIMSVEDPMDENSWDDFVTATKRLGDRVQIVDDDLIVTNPKFIRKAIKMGAGNTFLIKLNQIGTVSETLEAVRLARKNGFRTMISHRSGETGDTFVADFAVAVDGGELKAGAMARSERVEKYNDILRIEEEMHNLTPVAHYPNNVDLD
ncbi:phosphopyruvate hydratase [Lactobacillus sp. Sy-1]|uniref:phosphopyruvate hydratase n=1 Tax=Lactobacillus sp. Sy-1 TaxID=2109645 RepID=UPI001C5AF6BD|nr:phosphopyruvate hydratase [Lactobacillus sp. Sy-1]MBW1605877.1 phosphopyruvate hydratase [Lactobacillus sp. Sy-1]